MTRPRGEGGAKFVLREQRKRDRLREETQGLADCGRASNGRYSAGCRCDACTEAKHEQYVRRKVREASKPRTLMDSARELYKMVYWSGGEMRVFIFLPMGDEEDGDGPRE